MKGVPIHEQEQYNGENFRFHATSGWTADSSLTPITEEEHARNPVVDRSEKGYQRVIVTTN